MSNESPPQKPETPDWERIECEYRAGVMSLREIGAAHGITHGAINKRARRDGWVRDLAAKIQAKADALVSKALVSSEVSSAKADTERAVIEAGAARVAQIREEHRVHITRARALVLALLAECEAEAADPAAFAELGEMMRSPDKAGRDVLNDVYRKAISLPQRIKGVKELVDTLRMLVALEREAYGIAPIPAQAEQPKAADSTAMTVEEFRAVATDLLGRV